MNKKIDARIQLASLNKSTGDMLTTFVLTYPRIILPEILTHRQFCLDGDSELYFDLPGGTYRTGCKRLFKMKISDFVDKWHNGTKTRTKDRRKKYNTSGVCPDTTYRTDIISNISGFGKSNLHADIRAGLLPAHRTPPSGSEIHGRLFVLGRDFIDYVSRGIPHRTKMKNRLGKMKLRCLNEDTGEYAYTHVVNCFVSGSKKCFKVTTSCGSHITASKDHRVLTEMGWKTVEQLVIGEDKLAGRWCEEYKRQPIRKVDGICISAWCHKVKPVLLERQQNMCAHCGSLRKLEVHHVVPVHVDRSVALDIHNVVAVCRECHYSAHKTQGWQKGTKSTLRWESVVSVESVGARDTYDIEVAGDYPNFMANGLIVHNSRSTASSRATPAKRIRQQVLDDPFIPSYIGANRAGMQAGEALAGSALARAKALYKYARLPACGAHWLMEKMGIHKQITNRLLEPWVWVEQVVSATDLDNFFKLRTHWMAEPHFQELATKMCRLAMDARLRLIGGVIKCQTQWSINDKRSTGCGDIDDQGIQNLAVLSPGEWHLPFAESYMTTKDYTAGKIVSTARCARVSYYLKNGVESDYQSDLALYDRLVGSDPKHSSPTEHQAQAMPSGRYANFSGFRQHRWDIENS